MMEPEQRRHDYLHAMGISSWLPRAALPGAKTSAEWVHTFLYGDYDSGSDDYGDSDSHNHAIHHSAHEVEVAHQTTHQLSDTLKKPAAPVGNAHQQLQAGLDALSGDPVSASKPVAAKTAVPTANPISSNVGVNPTPTPAAELAATIEIKPRQNREETPSFRLAFWVFEQVVVIDSMPPQGRLGQNLDRHQTLCINMIRAMGTSPNLVASPYVLPWPILVGDALDQGRTVASEAVRYKLEKVLKGHAPRPIIVLGESAAKMVMQREENIDEMRGMVFNYRSDSKVVISHSLTQMLQIPECKKEVWQDLQPILPLNVHTKTTTDDIGTSD